MDHEFDAHDIGIGKLLKENRFIVPPHQREYSWTIEEVDQLLVDINSAFEGNHNYFLGSIMLINKDGSDSLSILDGQQRLATTTLLICAIRNYYKEHDTASNRHSLMEQDYLFKTDKRTLEPSFNLVLSERDAALFQQIVVDPASVDLRSKELLVKAYLKCTVFIENILSEISRPVEKLLNLEDYLLTKAQVIAVKTANESSAYIIFETLNDRGLSLSLADLVKNYLFGQSEDKLEQAKAKWISMVGAFAALDAEDEVKSYIRYYWLSKYGHLTEGQLFDELKKKITSKTQAVELIEALDKNAILYLAMSNPGHEIWRALGESTVNAIRDVNKINFIQYKPLMIAVLNTFNDREKKLVLASLENWAVRLIYGSGTRSGTISEKFSEVAVKISSGQITTARQVKTEIASILPDDDTFKEQMANCSIRSAVTSRYLLRKLEYQLRLEAGADPEFEVTDDPNKVNLEHILPKNLDIEEWDFDSDIHGQYLNRLGNQTLLLKTENSTVGSEDYASKLPTYQGSSLLLTSKIASDYESWNKESVNQRQVFMADLAKRTWPA